MRIDCPHCGARDAREFVYLGDATKSRPSDASAEAMTDYVYLRANPAGLHKEFWYHAFGCHAWLVVSRDTRNHDIEKVEAANARTSRQSWRGAT